jgi:hypothetical protein
MNECIYCGDECSEKDHEGDGVYICDGCYLEGLM